MRRAAAPDDAARLFLEHLPLVESIAAAVCARNHLSPGDAEDFTSDVKMKLIENDYAVLRAFEGRSSLRTFLTIVIQRALLDYRDRHWGKWRPSAPARRGGAVAMLLERLLTRDGHPFEEACTLLETRHGVTMSRHEFERLAASFPVRQQRRFETEDLADGVPASTPPPDSALVAREQAAEHRRIAALLASTLATLPPQDRLALALRYTDGRPVSEIARLLGRDQKALYRHFDRLLGELRLRFEREGVSWQQVELALEASTIEAEAEPPGASGVDAPLVREEER